MDNTDIPLCVDLDGTLIKEDVFRYTFKKILLNNPIKLLWFPVWLMKGRGYTKLKISYILKNDFEQFTYNNDLILFLRNEKSKGRIIVLVTGTDHISAENIAKHVGVFSSVLGSDERMNLTGRNKYDKLVSLYGYKKFDYVGNSWIDRYVWSGSRNVYYVALDKNFQDKIITVFKPSKIFYWD
jgi:hypothetical protein